MERKNQPSTFAKWRETFHSAVYPIVSFEPEKRLPSARYFRQKVIGLFTWLMVIIAVPFIFQYYTLGLWWMSASLFALGFVGLANIRYLPRYKSIKTGGHIGVAMLTIILLLSNSVSGGFYDPNFSWLYVLPLAAGALIDLKSAAFYGALVVVAVAVFFLFAELGMMVPDLIPAADYANQSFFNRLSASIAITALVIGFIFERNYNHREVMHSRETAEAASEAKSQFLANMSHEFRTPMNAVIGFTETMLEDVEDGDFDNLQADGQRILKASEHLLVLIGDLLDLARIEAKRDEFHISTIELRPFLQDVHKLVSERIVAGENRYEMKIDPRLSTVQTDEVRLRQILLNLLSNAAKFTSGGSITLEAGYVDDQATSMFVSVSDTGIGIADADISHIFKKFEQAHHAAPATYGGIGLGLAIAERLATSLGASLSVTSQLGEGSTFLLAIPMQFAAGGSAADDAS